MSANNEYQDLLAAIAAAPHKFIESGLRYTGRVNDLDDSTQGELLYLLLGTMPKEERDAEIADALAMVGPDNVMAALNEKDGGVRFIDAAIKIQRSIAFQLWWFLSGRIQEDLNRHINTDTPDSVTRIVDNRERAMAMRAAGA